MLETCLIVPSWLPDGTLKSKVPTGGRMLGLRGSQILVFGGKRTFESSILWLWMAVNPSGAEIRIFQENKVNTISADDLAPWNPRQSATILLTSQNEQILVLHEEEFQLLVSSQCYKKCKYIFMFPNINSAWQGLIPLMPVTEYSWGPFYWHELTLITAWISNYIHYKMWDDITYLFPKQPLNWEWINNFIQHLTRHMITYSYLDYS